MCLVTNICNSTVTGMIIEEGIVVGWWVTLLEKRKLKAKGLEEFSTVAYLSCPPAGEKQRAYQGIII